MNTPRSSATFRTTRWSLVHSARARDPDQARAALGELCRAYWYPLYAFARRRGSGPEEAQDLVQGFFADLLARESLNGVDDDGRRFRAWLLTGLKNHATDAHRAARAEKRGGGRAPVSIDAEEAERRYGLEPAGPSSPEQIFERRWAQTLLARVFEALRAEQEERGRGELFEQLKPFLAGGGSRPYAELAAELGLGEGALRVTVHRLRARYRELLESEVADTVGDRSAVEEELRRLFEALAVE